MRRRVIGGQASQTVKEILEVSIPGIKGSPADGRVRFIK
jgi:hypothetical protein